MGAEAAERLHERTEGIRRLLQDEPPEAVAKFKLPLLVLHGTADRLVPIAAGEMVSERAGSEDKTFKRYDGLFHEILNEPERQQVVDDIADWLDGRFTAP